MPSRRLLADPVRLQQVVANLLRQRRQILTRREGRIVLTAWLAEDQVFLEVVDSGPGINPASSARASSSRFGRRICRRGGNTAARAWDWPSRERSLCCTMANWARPTPIPGPGACFTFRFPLVPAEPPPTTPESECRRRPLAHPARR